MTNSGHTMRCDRVELLSLIEEPAVPAHIVEHLLAAHLELLVFADHPETLLPDVWSKPERTLLVVRRLRHRMQSRIETTTGVAKTLALGRAARELAFAERDLGGRPCQTSTIRPDAS